MQTEASCSYDVLGSAWKRLHCKSSELLLVLGLRPFGKDCDASQGWPPLVWRVGSHLEGAPAGLSRVGGMESEGNPREGGTVLAGKWRMESN